MNLFHSRYHIVFYETYLNIAASVVSVHFVCKKKEPFAKCIGVIDRTYYQWFNGPSSSIIFTPA